MIVLDIYFEKFGLVILLCLFVINSAWILYCFKTNRVKFILFPSILLFLVCAIIAIICISPNLDESEHLHCSWLVSQGLLPYKDFWQHHFPLLWLCLLPLIKNLQPSFTVYLISRGICAILFIMISLIGWKISQIVWKGKANLAVYLLLIFSGGIIWEFFCIRPDLFMALFLLLGVYFLLKMSEEKTIFSLLTGIMISFAMSFAIKQCLIIFLPVIIIFLGQKKSITLKLILYLAGLVIGCLPLLLYLFENNIIKEFVDSVFRFNSRHIIISGLFPLMIAAIGAAGWYLLGKEYQSRRDPKPLVLLIGFILVSLASLFKMYGIKYFYYLNFWLVLCAILGSGCNINGLLEKSQFGKTIKSLILGIALALLIISIIAPLKRYEFTFWGKDRKVISRLMDLCKNETCVILLPYHPIFARDATRLYSQWQYVYIALSDRWIKEDVAKKDIVENIIASSPAVISFYGESLTLSRYIYYIEPEGIFNSLKLMGLISQDGYEKIKDFIEQRYTTKEIGGLKFYIRNDKVDRYKWLPESSENEFERWRKVLGLKPFLFK